MAKKKRVSRTRAKQDNAETNGSNGAETDRIRYVSLTDETRRRYLNYALSVISSRALPDVRDGLKPVQRRILYVMYHELRLMADSKPRKCAKICGDTTGNYHPHGGAAAYDALVRMAQDFSLRCPLINGQGNFGSVMGLPAAAERYTEAKLSAVAEQLMSELRFDTVDTRPNYEGTREEPVVLPARYPNLLVNGTQGIAVGMATSIPPHNLGEVIRACTHLIGSDKVTVAQLMKHVRGPDFPLGGRLVTDRTDLRKMYEAGHGSVKVRGEWRTDPTRRLGSENRVVIYSVPYDVKTGNLMVEIGAAIESRKLPQLVDAIDETSDKHGLRIVLEMKPGSDPEAVLAYLYKHTSLENNFSYNATALVPDEHGALVPQRLNLVDLLRHFLDFRLETVRKRFQYMLEQLEKRIHILEGFEIVFGGLDKAIKIIRASNGKQDAAAKLMKAFPLDEIQTNAILELQLYRISKLEIEHIRKELAEKRAEANRLRKILSSERRLWKVVQTELEELSDEFADKRRTSIGSSDDITEFDAQSYIIRENTNVVVTRDGWIKRVGRLASVETTRVREGDHVLEVVPGNTVDSAIFFSSDGVAYTLPIDQIPQSSGYGEPLTKHVRMGDGVKIVAAVTTDARFTYEDFKVRKEATPGPYLLIVTERGQVMRISLSTFRPASTKVGRKYCRLAKDDRVVFVELVDDAKTMFIATRDARILHFKINEVPILQGPGKGVRGIRLEKNDVVLGARQLRQPSDALHIKNDNDRTLSFGQMKYGVTSRGGKGVKTSQRTGFVEIVHPEIELIDWSQYEVE